MDLKLYYQKMRKLESEIPDVHVIVVSLETADGGKAGRMTEVKREAAARMITEGRARLADGEESAEFRKTLQPARSTPGQPLNSFESKSLDEAVLKAMKETLRTLQE